MPRLIVEDEHTLSPKSREALITGLGVWVAGAIGVFVLGSRPSFTSIAIPAAFLTAPLMWFLVRFHLRDVVPDDRVLVALRYGVIITSVQVILDAAALYTEFRFGWLGLSEVAREVIVLGLLVGYACMLLIPWLQVRRRQRGIIL